MSSRYYPRYVRGNPQLRIFLPNFWIKLVKNRTEQPPNVVTFKVPLEMSDADIRNYLEKIYKIPVVHLTTIAYTGDLDIAKGKQYMVKADDYRMVYVKMPKDTKFTFPDLFPEEKAGELSKEAEKMKKSSEQFGKMHTKANQDRPNAPSWWHYF